MMDGTEFQFDIGKRVKLRDGVDPYFYGGMAKVGNEGWIGGHRRDRFGLPEVFIRWDANHWSYNRQPDQWTFQEHFDLAEETMTDNPKDLVQAAALEFANSIANIMVPKSDAPAEVVGGPVAERNAKVQAYAQTIKEAADAMVGSEAFICIAISRRDDERAAQGALHAEVVGDSLSPESETLVGMQMARYGAQFHANAATLLVHQFAAERERQESDGRAS